MTDIAIVDYGMGNLHSVHKALECVASNNWIVVTDDPDVVQKAKRIVLPGQGAMPRCMYELEARGLREAVMEAAAYKPFLGICLGLQMLFQESEEGHVKGLNILPGKVVRFPNEAMVTDDDQKLKVPHMGWNRVYRKLEHPLWEGIEEDARFYFVHSYYIETADTTLVAAQSNYPFSFTCAVAKDNIFAVQFHPEKSQLAGLTLLRNFSKWIPECRSNRA